MRQYIIATLAAALALTACTDDLEQPFTPSDAPGEARTLAITTHVMNETPALETSSTRATTGAVEEDGTDAITDLFVIQYDHEGKLLGSPQYVEYEANNMSASLLVPPTGASYSYKVVAVANTHDPSMKSTFALCATLDQFLALARTERISKDDDVFELTTNGTDITKRRLLMSAVVEIASGHIADINFQFYRNVAKLTLKIDNKENSGVTVKSVQLRNVPDRIFFAECLRETGTLYPKDGEVQYIDFPEDEVDIAAGSTTAESPTTMTYYLPRNCRGTSSLGNDNYYAKSDLKYVPGNATYVEIWATKTQGNTPVRYRFYLGGNMTNDYNVIHNHHYTLTVTINGEGAEQDARVSDLGFVELEEANCYIVNPLNNEMQSIYMIPATSRSNRFWSSSVGDGNLTLNDGDTWEAVVIWQDAAERLIDFCNPDGTISDSETAVADTDAGTEVTNAKFTSTKKGYICFKPRKGAEGNVVIGIRQPNSLFLWSWHLWITGYKPDDSKSFEHTSGRYIYTVEENGEVHHYEDHKNTSTANQVWAEGKRQHGKFMMDRNLGAMSASPADDYSKTGGFYYQYGRKDPFPGGGALTSVMTYDIFGTPQDGKDGHNPNPFKIESAGSNTDFREAVKNPTTFYTVTTGDWYGKNNGTNPCSGSYWNDPETSGTSAVYGKSIFDPSPAGWHLPQDYTWDVFSVNGNGNGGTPRSKGGFSKGYLFYISNEEGDNAPTAWYPASGLRDFSNGALGYGGSDGYYWGASPVSASNGRDLGFHGGYVNPMNRNSRGYGFPVRPLQE